MINAYAEYQLVVSLVRPETRIRVLSDVQTNIQDMFNEFGVQIMSPHFIDQPAEKVWSPKDQWFTAPAEPPADTPTGASPRPSPEPSA